MEKYPILQSGFVSLEQKGLTKPKPTDNLMIQRLLFKDHLVSNIDNFYFEPIVELYDLYRAEPTIVRDFEFRERLLIAVNSMFGTKSLSAWLMFQNKVASLTSLHLKFIDETMRFIAGTERHTTISQWINLIEISTHTQSNKIPVSDYFGRGSGDYGMLDHGLLDNIVKWTGRENGFEDLLISMFVIFGNRPYITNVREKNR